MEKVDFTPQQKIIVSAFAKEPLLTQHFYFTGGTALSVFYLGHRLSDDLDFFSEKKFNKKEIIDLVQNWAKDYQFRMEVQESETMVIVVFTFSDGEKVKVGFNYYPFRRLKESKIVNGVEIDNIKDIAVNKLITINQRTDAKDFVDLYFLRNTLSVWELMEGVKRKFGFEMDPVLIASDFLKIVEFDFLPKMVVPLNIYELQEFFKKQARDLSKTFTE